MSRLELYDKEKTLLSMVLPGCQSFAQVLYGTRGVLRAKEISARLGSGAKRAWGRKPPWTAIDCENQRTTEIFQSYAHGGCFCRGRHRAFKGHREVRASLSIIFTETELWSFAQLHWAPPRGNVPSPAQSHPARLRCGQTPPHLYNSNGLHGTLHCWKTRLDQAQHISVSPFQGILHQDFPAPRCSTPHGRRTVLPIQIPTQLLKAVNCKRSSCAFTPFSCSTNPLW